MDAVIEFWRHLRAETDFQQRYRRIRELADSVRLADIPATLARMDISHIGPRVDQTFQRRVQMDFVNLLLARLAKTDPKGAMEALKHVAPLMAKNGPALDFEGPDSAAEIILSEWVRQDQRAAIEWVTKQSPSDWPYGRAKGALFSILAAADPAAYAHE